MPTENDGENNGKTVILNGNFQRYLDERFSNLASAIGNVQTQMGTIDRKLDLYDQRLDVLEKDKIQRDAIRAAKSQNTETTYRNNRIEYAKLTAVMGVVVVIVNIVFHFWH